MPKEVFLHTKKKCKKNSKIGIMATEGTLKTKIYKILEGFSGGSHIFNLGHGILPQTPPENVSRLVEIINKWKL